MRRELRCRRRVGHGGWLLRLLTDQIQDDPDDAADDGEHRDYVADQADEPAESETGFVRIHRGMVCGRAGSRRAHKT